MKLKALLVEQERITGGEMHKSPSGAREGDGGAAVPEQNSKGKVEERKRNVPGILLC